MSDKPPLLPVLVGAGTTGLGLLNGFLFAAWGANLLLGRSDEDHPLSPLGPGLLGLLALFSLLQIPAGVGILIHRPWGKQLAQGMVFGVTVGGLLGAVPGFAGMEWYPRVISAVFAWGGLTGMAWAIALNVAFRFRSMKAPFGEDAPRKSPVASID